MKVKNHALKVNKRIVLYPAHMAKLNEPVQVSEAALKAIRANLSGAIAHRTEGRTHWVKLMDARYKDLFDELVKI